MTSKRIAAVNQGLFVVAVLVQLWMLYAPSVPSPDVGIGRVDLLGHLAIFAAVAWTGRRAGVAPRLLVTLLLVQALLSESIQWLLPTRSADPADLVADVLGILVGMGLPIHIRHRAAAEQA